MANHPATAAEPAVFVGAGTQSCAVFGQTYQRNPQVAEQVFFSWAQGFMSATNYSLSAANRQQIALNPDGASIDIQEAFIRDYCAGHPLDDYTMAVLKLMEQLHAMDRAGNPRGPAAK